MARSEALSLKDIYKDKFYMGIQLLGQSLESVLTDRIVDLAKELAIPIVATNDVYYPKADDAILREILLNIQFGKVLDKEAFLDRFSHEQYLKSSAEMVELFKAYPEALNCQDLPEYCIYGDTLTFEVPLILNYVANDINTFIPKEFILHQNYPNPFNPSTQITFDVPVSSDQVILTIYNVLGQNVNVLANEIMNAGTYTLEWNATDQMGNPVSSGIYFYELRTKSFTSRKKMLLIR